MITLCLTDPQKRALYWLPGDGSWRCGASHTTKAIRSLMQRLAGAVELKEENPESRKHRKVYYRLTPYGCQVRQAIYPQKPPQVRKEYVDSPRARS